MSKKPDLQWVRVKQGWILILLATMSVCTNLLVALRVFGLI